MRQQPGHYYQQRDTGFSYPPDPRFSDGSNMHPDSSYPPHSYPQHPGSYAHNFYPQRPTETSYEGEDMGEGESEYPDQASSSAGKNNTSRFAFSNENDQLQNRHPQGHPGQHHQQSYDRSIVQYGGQNTSAFQEQSSLVTPNNISYGGKKLQNQLEQVLMMKSGEFSAGGRGERHDGYLQNSTSSVGNIEGQNSSGGMMIGHPGGSSMKHSPPDHYPHNYGNPNFMPPAGHITSSQATFNRDGYYDRRGPYPAHDSRGNEYYKQAYPATFQNFEQNGSNQKNFATSQFAGEMHPHSKSNSQSDMKRSGLDYYPEADPGRNPMQQSTGTNFTWQRNSTQHQEQHMDERYMNFPKKQSFSGDPREAPPREVMNKRDRDYNQQPQMGVPPPEHHRISSGRRHHNEQPGP